MAFSTGKLLFPDPPAYRIGLDVMLLQLPKRDTFRGFVEIFSEQVGTTHFYQICHFLGWVGPVDIPRTSDTPPTGPGPIAPTARAAATVLSHMDAKGSIYEGIRARSGL